MHRPVVSAMGEYMTGSGPVKVWRNRCLLWKAVARASVEAGPGPTALGAVRQPARSARWDAMRRTFPLVSDEGNELPACMRYIELNPVRAGMLSQPAEYRCFSYRANAQGEANVLVAPHELHHALGKDAEERQGAFANCSVIDLIPARCMPVVGRPIGILSCEGPASRRKLPKTWGGG